MTYSTAKYFLAVSLQSPSNDTSQRPPGGGRGVQDPELSLNPFMSHLQAPPIHVCNNTLYICMQSHHTLPPRPSRGAFNPIMPLSAHIHNPTPIVKWEVLVHSKHVSVLCVIIKCFTYRYVCSYITCSPPPL